MTRSFKLSDNSSIRFTFGLYSTVVDFDRTLSANPRTSMQERLIIAKYFSVPRTPNGWTGCCKNFF